MSLPMAFSSAVACWGTLPSEIVLSIAEWVVIADIIHLQSVCTAWAWALGRISRRHPFPSPLFASSISFFQPTPWLILPNSAANNCFDGCAVYSIIEDRLYRIPSLPQIIGQSLLGTSKQGWLVTIDHSLTPHFLNLLTRQELSPPSLITIPSLFEPVYSPKDGSLQGLWYNQLSKSYYSIRSYYSRERFPAFVKLYLRKIIFTSFTIPEGLAVILLKGGDFETSLLFARMGDEAWSAYQNASEYFDFFEDVIFNEEDKMLYALSNRGAVCILECRSNSLEIISMVSMQIRAYHDVLLKSCIFFCHGDLMQVTLNLQKMGGNFTDVSPDEPAVFNVLKFNPSYNRHDPQIFADSIVANADASCWVPVNNLRGLSLFVDNTNCFIMDYADERRRNKVFFIYNSMPSRTYSHCDYGMFDMESYHIENLESIYNIPSEPLPIWFMPALTIV